jgi:hypothetical protein
MLKKDCHYATATAACPDINFRQQQSIPGHIQAGAMQLFAFQDVIYNPPDSLN